MLHANNNKNLLNNNKISLINNNSPSRQITEKNGGDSLDDNRLTNGGNSGSSNSTTPLQSFSAMLDKVSPRTEKKVDQMTYIQSELDALEREQEAIDLKASALEVKLRNVMGGNNESKWNRFLKACVVLIRISFNCRC